MVACDLAKVIVGVRFSLPAPKQRKNMSAKFSSEKAVNEIGNRYDLILVASQRVRELRKGHQPKIRTKNGPVVTALTEIEEGHVGRDHLRRIK
jgi:DNA-directed RNA polymerase subunit omega